MGKSYDIAGADDIDIVRNGDTIELRSGTDTLVACTVDGATRLAGRIEAALSESGEMFEWLDFEAEPNLTGDGSGDPETFYLTIREAGEELSVIAHRTCGGKYPIDGELANEKRANAQRIVDALNASE